MSESIKQESRDLSRSPLDADFMRKRYKTENDIFTFASPSFWVLEKNLYFLLRNSEKIDLDVKYHYRPDYLSKDTYGTTSLWYLILFINGIEYIEGFTVDSIYVPTKSAIVDLCRDNITTKYSTPEEDINW